MRSVFSGLAAAAATLLGLTLFTATPAHAAPEPTDASNGTASAGAMPSGRMTPLATAGTPSSYPVKGIDVASYQGNVDWAKVAAAGKQFAYVKATEGTSYTSSYFDGQYNGAKAAGLFAGAYAFGRPDIDPKAQANYLYRNAQYVRDGKTLPLMLDVEWPYSSLGIKDACWNKTPAQMVSWIRTFVSTAQHLSASPVLIYTNYYWWVECTDNSAAFANQYLTLADYSSSEPPMPAGWTSWTFWQYSSTGSVPGISGNVDLDVFHGSLAQLKTLALADWSTSGVSGLWTGSQYHVFGHNSKGQVIQAYWNGSRWKAQDLGGATVGTPASTYHSGRYDIFAVTSAGNLYQRTYNNGHWDSWHKIAIHWATSGVSAVWTGSTYHVFGHGSGGQLVQAYWNGSAWKVQSLKGITSGTPASTYHAGRYDVFAVTPAGNLYQRTNTNGHWDSWHKIASGWATSGASAVWTGSQYHVFGHDATGAVVQAAWTGTAWVQQNLGGVTAGTPASIYDSGRYDLFGVASSASLYQRTFSGTWDGWHKIA